MFHPSISWEWDTYATYFLFFLFVCYLKFGFNIAFKVEKDVMWHILNSFFTSQKSAILTGVCWPFIHTVCYDRLTDQPYQKIMTALWHYVFVILAFISVEFHDETVAQCSLCIRLKHDAFRLNKPLTYSLRLT